METQPCCCQHFLCVCQNKAASQLFYQRSSPPCHSLCCIPVVTAKTTPIRLGSASHRTEKKKKKEGVLHPSHKGIIAHCICGSMPSTTVTSKTPSKYYKQPSWKTPFRMSFFKFLKFYLPATPTDSSYWSCILAYSYKDINHTRKLQHTHEVI